VLLVEGAPSVALSGPGGLKIRADGFDDLSVAPGREVRFRVFGEGLLCSALPGRTLPPVVTVEGSGGKPLTLEGVAYPGRIELRSRAGSVEAIDEVGLESYLEGVVALEMGRVDAEGFAALEAQAVAARTYSLAMMEKRRGERFDLYAGVRDQVYRGLEGRFPMATEAVRRTRGMVLEYQGELVRTYYCAACGGHTASIDVVWPDRPSFPYLQGVRDAVPGTGAFCRASRHFRWRYSFTGAEVGEMLRQKLPLLLGLPAEGVGYLVDLRIEGRSRSGRVKRLVVDTTRGRFVLEGDSIRRLFDVGGGRILPSTMFDLEKQMLGGRLAFVSVVGGGNGHGVGLCQSGALGMARRGYRFESILAHYYPGTQLVRRY